MGLLMLAAAKGTSIDVKATGPEAGPMMDALEAPRLRLLTQFNGLPEGVKFLVDMRAELHGLARQDPIYQGVLDDLTRLNDQL